MDGFVEVVRVLLTEAGIPHAAVHRQKSRVILPGFYRPEKQWDLLVLVDNRLIATIEFKSQAGSFGNNYNNRTEEAIGNAVDLRTAYREGAFKPSSDRWLGYLMLLEDAEGSRCPIGASQPHFPIFPGFRGASYARRYELLLTKLVRERLYNAACFILSVRGSDGAYEEPSDELSFRNFAASLLSHATSYMKTRGT